MATTRVTVLVENTAGAPGLSAEHGLAYWIEHGGRRVLFDTGQTTALASNARRLDVPLDQLDALVLSHGHYDHTGGVTAVLGIEGSIPIYAHPAAFAPKFARRDDGTARAIGMSLDAERAIRQSHHRWIATTAPTKVFGGLMVTGFVPRQNDFEDTGGPFFLDEACREPDPLEDDQSIFFDTAEGTVVLLGCAHSGVINTLAHICRLTGDRPLHAVIGGMHLVGASGGRIERTIDEFRRLGIAWLAPGHCTGKTAVAALGDALAGRCRSCSGGSVFVFESE